MEILTRGPLPLLICSRGVGLQGKYHIWYYTISSSLAVHTDQCRVLHALILWAGPPLMVQPMSCLMDTGGHIPTLTMCILILRVDVVEMLSVASSSHACRERVGRDRDHQRSRVQGDHRGVWGGDSRAGGDPDATTNWLSWHRACPRQAPVHNPIFFIITIYICYVHLSYRNFMEPHA